MKYDYRAVPDCTQFALEVHDEQDNHIATCWAKGNAKRIVDALNSQSRIAALEAEVGRLNDILDVLRCKECKERFDDDGCCDCLPVQDCCGELPELCECENPTPEIDHAD